MCLHGIGLLYYFSLRVDDLKLLGLPCTIKCVQAIVKIFKQVQKTRAACTPSELDATNGKYTIEKISCNSPNMVHAQLC